MGLTSSTDAQVTDLSTMMQKISAHVRTLSTQNEDLRTRLQTLEVNQAHPKLEGEFVETLTRVESRRRRRRRAATPAPAPAACSILVDEWNLCHQAATRAHNIATLNARKGTCRKYAPMTIKCVKYW